MQIMRIKGFAGYVKKLLHAVQPHVPVGGLEISDSTLSYVSLDANAKKIKVVSVKMPAQAIQGGVMKDAAAVRRSLNELHNKITHKKENRISVIVSLSDVNVYSQTFSLPPIEESNKKEAIRLNLETISPIKFSEAYTGYQLLGKGSATEEEYLASFSDSSIINSTYQVLKDSFFSPIAIEQRAYSLARLITQLGATYDQAKSYFVLHISGDGLSFSVIRNGNLYFNRFVLWDVVLKNGAQDRQISFQEFEKVIVQESRRVINYFSSRFSDNIQSIYIVAPGLEDQVTGIVEKNLPYSAELLTIKNYEVGMEWAASLGAALRGLVPRSRDFDISVAPEDAQEVFFHSQILSFITLWRNLAAVVFFVILLSLLVTFSFLRSYETQLAGDLSRLAARHNVAYLKQLQDEAKKFNTDVEQALEAHNQQTHWENQIRKVFDSAQGLVTIVRFYAQSKTNPIILNGEAPNEQAVVAFKNNLESLKIFSNVDLPLSAITPLSDSRVSFKITFKILDSAL